MSLENISSTGLLLVCSQPEGEVTGELSAGRYRIGKEFMDFRKTGDYDKEICYAEFEII